ncbi:MAG: exodeoxyribonuclease VII large subunit [Spirochaeta sp.]|jgi:exodeoxyribonuclease VII large subunit|nr:exodeoxyribonuclease VII large subunit [Spirochaeta sp.]
MLPSADDAARVFAVSEITNLIKTTLEGRFPRVMVTGEVSNFRPAASGHWYFSLKDADAVIQCAMFRGSQRHARSVPADGDLVEVAGAISVYPPRGSYQLIVHSMRQAGRGDILALLDDRKRRLAAEGLFEQNRPLPTLPAAVAVVTSPTGAAIRDIIDVLRRRRTRITIRIVPVPVQGDQAASRIAAAVRYAGFHRLGETIIVGRGGGSIEDLLPFSDEAVIRAIAASPVPVVSAVGHETDWALSDLAADSRAPTPSAAAELVSAVEQDIAERIALRQMDILRGYRSHLDGLQNRLARVGEEELRYRFRNLVQPWYQRLDDARARIIDGVQGRLQHLRHRVALLHERIDGASPYEPLNRGFALIRDARTDSIVLRAERVPYGEPLRAQFADGSILVERIDDEKL